MNTEARRQDLCSSCPYHDRIVSVETITQADRKRLWGNGQPGDIDKMRMELGKSISELREDLSGDIDGLRKEIATAREETGKRMDAMDARVGKIERLVERGLGIIGFLSVLALVLQNAVGIYRAVAK